jgi:hypothetical protein
VGDVAGARAPLARDAARGGARVRSLPPRSRPTSRGARGGPAARQIRACGPLPLHRRADCGVDRRGGHAAHRAQDRDVSDPVRAAGRHGDAGRRSSRTGPIGLRRRRRDADRPQREVREVPRAAAAPDHDQRPDALPASPGPPQPNRADRGAARLDCRHEAVDERRADLFRALRARAGILPRSAACRPRMHDLRHSFAVRTLLDAYRTDGDPGPRIAALSTYLGHVNPGKTYWYLHGAPELLELAGGRLQRHLGDGR